MPLILITTTDPFYPSDGSKTNTESQAAIAHLGRELPGLVVEHADELHLTPGTPELAIQVNYERYHPLAVNAAEIWVEVRLTEAEPDEDTKHEVREVFKRMLLAWARAETTIKVEKISSDIFWTNGSGFLQYGQISEVW